MERINFRPWIGTEYNSGGIFGKRILVLSESHYCSRELAEGGKCHPICRRELMYEECFSQTEQVVIESGDSAPVWVYTIDGKRIPAMRVYHPSAPVGKNWDYWHFFHRQFLGLKE